MFTNKQWRCMAHPGATRSIGLLLGMIFSHFCGALHGRGQDVSVPGLLEDLVPSLEQWAAENLDDETLAALPTVDRERVREFLQEFQRRFQNTSVYELSGLKETAARLMPVLQSFEETRGYAGWLEAHTDYLEVADQLLRQLEPALQPSHVPKPVPRPEGQRAAWTKTLQQRPLPARAKAFVPRLKQIFQDEKAPPELVWVAEVESSFNPNARSPAGAVGLFQLMPITARGMKLATQPHDERLHPDKSGRAAARYLRHLHQRFRDWPLALAAYNAGETRVDQLLRRHKAREFDQIARHLPAETQMFVPKVEATVRRREGRTLAQL